MDYFIIAEKVYGIHTAQHNSTNCTLAALAEWPSRAIEE